MQTVYLVIGDNGDGSQSIEWYDGKLISFEKLESLCQSDKYDRYQSGDGIQISILEFPDSLNLKDIKGIYWSFEKDFELDE